MVTPMGTACQGELGQEAPLTITWESGPPRKAMEGLSILFHLDLDNIFAALNLKFLAWGRTRPPGPLAEPIHERHNCPSNA